jgi:hypothetical protein
MQEKNAGATIFLTKDACNTLQKSLYSHHLIHARHATGGTMAEQSQIVIRVPRDHLQQFRAACILRGTSPTKELGRLLVEQLTKWEKERVTIHKMFQ